MEGLRSEAPKTSAASRTYDIFKPNNKNSNPDKTHTSRQWTFQQAELRQAGSRRALPDKQTPLANWFKDNSVSKEYGPAQKNVFFQESSLPYQQKTESSSLFFGKQSVAQQYSTHPGHQQSQSATNDSFGLGAQFFDSEGALRPGRRKFPVKETENEFIIDPYCVGGVQQAEADGRTTVMIRNIPNKYDQSLMLQKLNSKFRSAFDFFYLPIDFKVRRPDSRTAATWATHS